MIRRKLVYKDGKWQRIPITPEDKFQQNRAYHDTTFMRSTPHSSYDSAWDIVVNPADDTVEAGAFVGNGKIGLLAAYGSMDLQKAFITGNISYDKGSYKTNTMETFRFNACKMFSLENNEIEISPQYQALSMDIGICNTNMTIRQVATNHRVNVDFEVYAIRQHPFSVMTTIRFKPMQAIEELLFHNEPYAPTTMTQVQYNNNVIFNDQVNPDTGIYILNGSGLSTNSKNTKVAFGNVFLFEMPNGEKVDNLGFNVYRYEPGKCYNIFKFKDLQADTVYTMHIISTCLSSDDFDDPVEEVKRVSLTLATRPNAAAVIRQNHIKEWNALWATNVTIDKKANVTDTSIIEQLAGIQKQLRYSLYNIYSSIRENVRSEINPMNLSIIDIHGSALMQGDIWLLPTLILLKPKAARTLLEYRYATLENAIQLASSYGHEGSKYPYINDVLGYKNALYWDGLSAAHIFNTGVISVNVWNYYRMTSDIEWLRQKGYAILRNNADFFVSVCEEDENGLLHTKSIVALSEDRVSETNNAFTNMLIRLSMRVVIEASYELGYRVKEEWLNVYHSLIVPYYEPPDYDVIKFDQEATEFDTYSILEPLLLLIPTYWSLFTSKDVHCTVPVDIVKKNLEFYRDRMKSGTTMHPFNTGVITMLSGIVAQKHADYSNTFFSELLNFVDTSTSGPYKNFKLFGINTKYNDVSLCAMFVLIILQSICGIEQKGGVAETKFYYEEFKIKHNATAIMPNFWKNVKVTGLGAKKETFNSVNPLVYSSSS
jgi:protein-glucosylgalactosylhydroxylysine glucosidase